jgi:superfamily II DNA or RNA helicase
MSVELTEALLGKAAGWEAMKRARAYLEQDQVLSSNWTPPLLKGVVQAGELSFRAGLVIKGPIDVENICSCRESREWGTICAHSVAVGLHWVKRQQGELKPGSARLTANTALPAMAAMKTSTLLREPGGELAELFVILPPNFEQAAVRGKVMLVLEAKWSGGRCPLNALPKGRPFAFSKQDSAIIDQLEAMANGETPAMLQIETRDFASVLPALVDHPSITLGKSGTVTVTKTPFPLPLRATLETNGEIVLSLAPPPPALSSPRGEGGRSPGAGPAVSPPPAPLLLGDSWTWQNRVLQPLGLPPAMMGVLRAPVRVPRSQVPQFLSQHWAPLQAAGGIAANFKLEDFTLEPQAPRFLLELKGGLAQLSALLQCAYGSRIMTVGVTASSEGVWLPDPEVPTRYSTRDVGAERAALARLQRSGFAGPDGQGRWQLNGQNAVLNFFAREFPKLQREWTVTLEERLERSTAQNLERIEPQFQISSSGVQWFDLGVVFASSGGEKFSAADIQRLILSGQGHTRLKNGKVAVIDTGAVEELQEVLLDCSPLQHGAGYRMSGSQAGFLEATLKQHPGWNVQAPAAWRERAARQSGEAKLECPPLGELDGILRPYQKEGVAWLQFLRENGFGGILADEMGLGKTLQTLAFLQSRTGIPPVPQAERRGAGPVKSPSESVSKGERDRRDTCPTLVVCPTSLVFNWVAEARKFTPALRVLALHGPERHRLFAQIPQCDLIVTSYALIRRDAERYREMEFDTVVLDEAQHIKNRQTQNAQAVKAVKCRHRLVLTGTPLENSVLDLWSIFDFLMPGYLGAAQAFRERYELPITRDKNSEAQARLARRLRPFILRRLKKDVAADLPAKLEQVSFCELTPDQRNVYQQVIEASRKEVLDAVGAQGLAKSRMVVLSALLRLRQICCDLRLLKLDGVEAANASGKLDLFGELLEEVIDGGHRVLVFSQFVSMLMLLKEKLTAEGIAFCYLDGSTTDRAAVVERFQTDDAIPVFLISLKAGGVGLNLTGADTVIHFDPWWNPAVEDQATDRAHRIGQTRVVTSYKLITRDTVEEKILTLQHRKREIIKATLGSEEELAAALNWEDIQELLGV